MSPSGSEGRIGELVIHHLDYDAGYQKALMDFRSLLSTSTSSFRSDRKRNNVQNVVWMLDCLITDYGKLATYGDEIALHFREKGNGKNKRIEYYIVDEWPIVPIHVK